MIFLESSEVWMVLEEYVPESDGLDTETGLVQFLKNAGRFDNDDSILSGETCMRAFREPKSHSGTPRTMQ